MTSKLLTTLDNPYDPFEQPDLWRQFDHQKGYFTNNYVARVALTSPDMSEAHEIEAINEAVDECAKYNVLGIYRVVEREVPLNS